MRTELVHPGAENLKYEIRGIVEVAKKIEALGQNISWENIGDPIAKGETVPEWIKDYVRQTISENKSFGYSPTRGVDSARQYIAKERNLEGGIQIRPEDILFFNGLGDAISTLYDHLHPTARVIGPNPAYPTHSSAEAAHADAPHITYALNPYKGWQPDLAELEEKVKANPAIAGILIINPDNPTGFVYPIETISKMVDIAKRYNLFLISDEIYSNLAFPESGMQKLAQVVGAVPAIAMRGISKEFPWPGSRCGWVEFYNRDKDANFDKYAESLLNAKMLEVCSTTLPQTVLPQVMSDERYYPYLAMRIQAYDERSKKAVEVLGTLPGLLVTPAQGAFYMTVVFEDGVLTSKQSLQLSEDRMEVIEPYLKAAMPDQRFVYYLLASTGICTVPLSSGFNSKHQGFRFTLLESDPHKYGDVLATIRDTVTAYLNS